MTVSKRFTPLAILLPPKNSIWHIGRSIDNAMMVSITRRLKLCKVSRLNTKRKME